MDEHPEDRSLLPSAGVVLGAGWLVASSYHLLTRPAQLATVIVLGASALVILLAVRRLRWLRVAARAQRQWRDQLDRPK